MAGLCRVADALPVEGSRRALLFSLPRAAQRCVFETAESFGLLDGALVRGELTASSPDSFQTY